MGMNAARPVEKVIVLVGAGNAHLVFLRRWRMRPRPGVAVTLANDAPVVAYSAMVPAHVGGDYTRDEVTIDLVPLCRAAGVRLVAERVTAIDPAARLVHFRDRPPLPYDLLSLGLGSLPARPPAAGDDALAMRPLLGLVDRIDQLEARLRDTGEPCRFVVVGGGASGCELALAVHRRLGAFPGFRLTVLPGGPRLLPTFPARAGRHFEAAMKSRGVAVRFDARVTDAGPGHLVLAGGERLPFDAAIWATDPAPPAVLRESGLAVDAGGFLRVGRTLQSVSDPAVFGTGDCVAFDAYPTLPRNGVHAVRQGAVLFDNVIALLRGRRPRPFRPRRVWLSLLNTSDGEAVLSYGPLTWKGRCPRRWKDDIDRAWIDRFARLRPMTPAATDDGPVPVRCGGCGSKVPGDVLGAVLRRLDVPDDPRVPLGCRAGEDAAVFRAGPGQDVLVQTVDHFTTFTDDPYLFGRVAALHAVGDLYAMNARPFAALAVATLPPARGRLQEAVLHDLLAGATRELNRLGVTLAGGHTTEGDSLALGFAVTGTADEGRLFRKGRLRPGDALVLTKPLGTGAILAAWMRGECGAAWLGGAVASMLTANDTAAGVFADVGVTACTDVTGFGLAGHLFEMLDASGVSAVLWPRAVPLLTGFEEVVGRGIVSTLHEGNARGGGRVAGDGPPPAWLFDPQTSGGLLAGVSPERVEEVVRQLEGARVIGRVVAGEPPVIRLDGAR
jgi:selenide,water dikinase